MSMDKRPAWIRTRISLSGDISRVVSVVEKHGVNTVCREADCPNKGICWEGGHVTFLILGKDCTRNCLFCNVRSERPQTPDVSEPDRIALAVKDLGMKYVVITSVTRDDLDDGGSAQFIATVNSIKKAVPKVMIELLIPDFGGREDLLAEISALPVEVIGHNMEIPHTLYGKVRPAADYRVSLKTLDTLNRLRVKFGRYYVKSSLILGLGESVDDIYGTMDDMADSGVDIIYLGQYLAPTMNHWPVYKYYTPGEFADLEMKAKEKGFKAVVSAPLARSSYRAFDAYVECSNSENKQ